MVLAMALDSTALRAELERVIGHGQQPTSAAPGLTPRAKRVISLAAEEAKTLRHPYIGTGHLLLGLIREDEGIAGKILARHAVTLDGARSQVLTSRAAE
jgi:ATP-dependent Clp protease ATP-binding subunit ClpC